MYMTSATKKYLWYDKVKSKAKALRHFKVDPVLKFYPLCVLLAIEGYLRRKYHARLDAFFTLKSIAIAIAICS